MYRKRSTNSIREDIEKLQKEADVKENELEKLNDQLNYLHSELRFNIQEEKAKTMEVSVTYGGRLPVAPERKY